MLTVQQITQNIVNQLRLLDPAASAEVGTPERKMIEAVAEMIASSQVDFTVLNQQHDIDSMSGGRLDAYLSVFGFSRQAAIAAYGTVTFSRNTANTNAIIVPIGTQVQAFIDDPFFPTLTYVTVQTVVLEAGRLSVQAPVQCSVAGTVGNIDAGQVVGFGGLRTVNGITGVTNEAPIQGGQDAESDAQYKTRFQNSFLRNISGTTDMFLALAVSQAGVTKANVVGPVSRYQEYVQVPAADDTAQQTGTGGYDDAGTVFPHKRTSEQSTVPYSKYTWPDGYYLTDSTLDPATAVFFRPGVDFVFNSPPVDASSGTDQVPDTPVTSPNVTFLNAYDSSTNPAGNQKLAENEVVLLEHAYMSVNSRNDIDFGVLNCVDLFVDGVNATAASSTEALPGTSHDLQNTDALLWTYQKTTAPKVINFRRAIDSAPCTVGNRIQPLYWQPVVDLPNSITVGSSTYYRANYYKTSDSTYYNQLDEDGTYHYKAHYAACVEVNSHYGSVRARNGIEWFLTGPNHVAGQLPDDGEVYSGSLIEAQTGTVFTVDDYLYDQNVTDLQAIAEKNKQVTQDVLVHKAKLRYFRPIVTVMYTLGATRATVDASIAANLAAFFRNQYFGSAIQLSDILQVVHNTPGVDNVRWTNNDDGEDKMEEVGADGRSLDGGPVMITSDFFLQDNELPAVPSANAVAITVRAQNTWSS